MTDIAEDAGAADVMVRRARVSDVRTIRRLVDTYVPDRRLLEKEKVTLFESVQEFVVAELDGQVVGCGALHVIWEELGEVRTLAVDPAHKGHGIGGRILERLIGRARVLGLHRIFCLTFEVDFFGRYGFKPIVGEPITPEVHEELLRSHDEGVAEFLELERVKPNTLGNSRLLLEL